MVVVYALPNDNIEEISRLKVFADNRLNSIQIMNYIFHIVEGIVE